MRFSFRAGLVGPAVLAALMALSASGAHAALFDDEEARKAILELRVKLEQSNEQARARQAEQTTQVNAQLQSMNEQLSQMRRSMLELNNQIESLRMENAKLRGQDEQLARDVAEVQRTQKDIQQGVEDRVRKLEPQKVVADGKEFLADAEEKRLYDDAMAVMRKGEFDKASVALAGFQRRFPASGYTESVLFWLGNAQYGSRNYKDAIASFRALLGAAPDHPRAPEALLSIANCQIELKDTRSARRTVDELVKTYPKSEAAQAGKERIASLR